MKNSTAFLLGTGVTLVAVALISLFTGGERTGAEERSPELHAKSLRENREAGRSSEEIRLSALEKEVARMSLQEVCEELPEGLEFTMFIPGLKNPRTERIAALYRRLGHLKGREALDETVANSNLNFMLGQVLVPKLSEILAGWMKVDPESARAAFREMTTGKRIHEMATGFEWNGKALFKGLG